MRTFQGLVLTLLCTGISGCMLPPEHTAFFVAPYGNDQQTGSLEQPFRTIGKAVEAAPAGTTVFIRGGSYHEPLLLSGKKGDPKS